MCIGVDIGVCSICICMQNTYTSITCDWVQKMRKTLVYAYVPIKEVGFNFVSFFCFG